MFIILGEKQYGITTIRPLKEKTKTREGPIEENSNQNELKPTATDQQDEFRERQKHHYVIQRKRKQHYKKEMSPKTYWQGRRKKQGRKETEAANIGTRRATHPIDRGNVHSISTKKSEHFKSRNKWEMIPSRRNCQKYVRFW